uniref:Uncharacterized protein n=1 Tax=Cucumis sativus TaxID=3659 RepID=A0A0A0LPJ7_CUCSA
MTSRILSPAFKIRSQAVALLYCQSYIQIQSQPIFLHHFLPLPTSAHLRRRRSRHTQSLLLLFLLLLFLLLICRSSNHRTQTLRQHPSLHSKILRHLLHPPEYHIELLDLLVGWLLRCRGRRIVVFGFLFMNFGSVFHLPLSLFLSHF